MFSTGNYNKKMYTLHYSPKLTKFLLADSHVTSNIEDPESVRASKTSTIESNKLMENLIKIEQKIRYNVQSFIATVGQNEPMSIKLEFAIQNLLMNILGLAKQLKQQYVKELMIEGKQSEQSSSPNLSQFSNHEGYYLRKPIQQNAMRIQDSEDLFVLKQCSQEQEQQSFSSATKTRSYCDKKASNKKLNKAYNEVIEKFIRMQSKYQYNDPLIFHKKSSDESDVSSSFSKSGSTIKQIVDEFEYCSLERETQSQIGTEEQPLTTSILPKSFVRTNNYHTCDPYETKFQGKYQQRNVASKQNRNEIENSISEYYIEQSSRISGESEENAENKENCKISVNQFMISSKKNDKTNTKIDGTSYLYSQVVSRRKIF